MIAIAYTVLALGIPIPLPAGRVGKELFPCMNHHCGCQSAEECWRNCCCMTLEERMIWARENHVRPPEYALAAARSAGIEWVADWPSDENQLNCRENCRAEQDVALRACQETSDDCSHCRPVAQECPCCAGKHGAGKNTTEVRRAGGVLLAEALKCHGVSENWQSMAISLQPPTGTQVRFPNEVVEKVNLFSTQFSSISFPPDVPPPRFLVRG